MKILILGNCQSAPLRNIVRSFLPDAEVPFLKPVHLFNESDCHHLFNEIKKSDIIITQRITDNYLGFPIGTNQIKKAFGNLCNIVVIPNAHFDGYFPTFLYLKDFKYRSISPRFVEYSSLFISDYHEGLCVSAKLKGRKLDYLMSFYDDAGSYKKSWSDYWFDDSLDNLLRREVDADFGISDYINDHARDRQLFWTFNHPSNEILIYIVKKALTFAEVMFQEKNIEKELLDETIFPIFPASIENLGLRFSPRNSIIADHDWGQYIKRCWSGYDEISSILKNNIKSRKFSDFMGMM